MSAMWIGVLGTSAIAFALNTQGIPFLKNT